MKSVPGRTILYIVTEDWYFASHRLPMARAAKDAGFRVVVATRVDAHRGVFESEGFELLEFPNLRRGLPFWREVSTILGLRRLIADLRPNLVHMIALKPAVFGTMAARWAGTPPVLVTFTGLGFVFTSISLQAKVLRPLVLSALRYFLRHPSVYIVAQNSEDFGLLAGAGLLSPQRSRIIHGSGVDVSHYLPLPEPEGPFTCAAACRMLGDKGIYDLVEAARLLRTRGTPVRWLLAGPADPLNPTAVPEKTLRAWSRDGLVEWLGQVADIREVWRKAHLAVLPSHREGLPKALIEAAACGRAIVATDTTGCREVVQDGVTGLLVSPRSPAQLADAVERLAKDAALRVRMGARGRLRVEEFFAETIVTAQTKELYERLARPG